MAVGVNWFELVWFGVSGGGYVPFLTFLEMVCVICSLEVCIDESIC